MGRAGFYFLIPQRRRLQIRIHDHVQLPKKEIWFPLHFFHRSLGRRSFHGSPNKRICRFWDFHLRHDCLPGNFPLTCWFLVVGIALLYLIINPVNVSRTEKRFLDALSRVTITLNDIFKNKKLFKKLFLNNSILVFLTGLRLFIACKAIGVDFELLHCYLYTTVWAFVRLIPMLQSDIGSRELATGFLSEILGSGFKQGILATVVDRIFEMALALVGTTIFKNILLSSRHEPDNTKRINA